ncbi:fumarylacetoacetate hydrolase family protein [Phenylobacterium montanum]|uniref:Fumarylacetoacetate hydrolase family protein n=1 Tax=Phenylobacterium montanum TaxID=2823693 RepID=A0A975IWW5_9CAUL|nr:fumarylacetoacetate hydrolase family protein [Caulobacter sp. S6]QUD90270.1 fumarylacetoacetate hydrolase family protein [Caulobacter sp. S6]
MKYASFEAAGLSSWGLVEGEDIVDVGEILRDHVADLKDLIAQEAYGQALRARASAARRPLSTVTLRPVVSKPAKIFCVGHNYETHRQETGRAMVGHPSIFLRFADTLTAHGAPILRPKESASLDYEGELAVIIGQGGRRISEADALRHVAGFTCANDASVRDWQWHTQQFTPGKNFPGTAPLGPWMITPDEIADLQAVTVTTSLNGEVMQHASVADMIFPIPVIIAYLSTFTSLSPGDVILTGTPGGVGAKRKPPVWMKPGDIVEVGIAGVGRLVNFVCDEA